MRHIVHKLINVLLLIDNDNSNTPISQLLITENEEDIITEDGEFMVTE